MKKTYLWHNEDDAKQAVKLIRAERKRVRRMVEAVLKEAKEAHFGEVLLGHELACDDILARLKEGR